MLDKSFRTPPERVSGAFFDNLFLTDKQSDVLLTQGTGNYKLTLHGTRNEKMEMKIRPIFDPYLSRCSERINVDILGHSKYRTLSVPFVVPERGIIITKSQYLLQLTTAAPIMLINNSGEQCDL